MSEFIYLVVGNTDHEGSDPIKAFKDKPSAEEFAKTCMEYEKSRPEFPDSDDDKTIARWERRQKKWRKNHPAGEYSHAWYGAVEVQFVNGETS